ncbi:Alpha/Beta hydrolase protein [Stachybotrys elegans]|uniref:Alpha/Beta hydrolase protein n=1 Tax=Stachybotrys elegans TaxID=80388 RepID=A0A8K0T173_9HYPO|nr:Alpha/Beta hydrolase protein [Stachybotrys elegans]
MAKPSLIFVPGAWHSPETWDKLIAILQPRGFRCASVCLPSTAGDLSASFVNDVKAVQTAIEAETKQGNNVVLVVHSYGGHVGNSAIKGFTRKPDTAESSSGYVIGLAMIATGFTIAGMVFFPKDSKPLGQWVPDFDAGIAKIVADPRDMFYHDLPEEEAEAWVKKLTTHSIKSLTEDGEYSYEGWKDVPCWYLVTKQDHALLPQIQQYFIDLAKVSGGNVTAREVESSHSPMLSKPFDTAQFVEDAVADFVSRP